MSEIQRYDITNIRPHIYPPYFEMKPQPDGGWVEHAAHLAFMAAKDAEIARLIAENKRLLNSMAGYHLTPVVASMALDKIIELLRPSEISWGCDGYVLSSFDIEAIEHPLVRNEVKRLLEKRA